MLYSGRCATFGDYMATVVQDTTGAVNFEPEVKRARTRDRPKNKVFINSHAKETAEEIAKSSCEAKETPKQIECEH